MIGPAGFCHAPAAGGNKAPRWPTGRSLEALEQTPWAIEFKADSPVSYPAALRFAQEDRLEVLVEKTNEAGFSQWVARVFDEPSFWMEAKPTKAEVLAVCKSMGWKVIR